MSTGKHGGYALPMYQYPPERPQGAKALNRGEPEEEDAMRAVWPLEIFNMFDVDSGPNTGLTAKGSKNLRWTFQNPDGWRYWVYNMSTGALATGSKISIITKNFGLWVS